MNIQVDPILCTACGMCVDTCPEVFEMGIDAAEIIIDPVPLDQMDLASEAEENCPTGAITISTN